MDPVWLLTLAVFAPVFTGVVSLWLPRAVITPRVLLALSGPAASFAVLWGFYQQLPETGGAAPATAALPWLTSLHLDIAYLPDGLGLFFALLVSGIGSLIVLYARGYFGPARDDLYRFYPTLGLFTTAMLGIVLADYTLLTLLFWEMTSISSFLLIGWDRYDRKAVKLAMQAFFTTGLGGMGLFGGLLLLGMETGVWRWSDLLATPWAELTAGDWPVTAAFVLMFIGAATKSAQYPFHYWLPGAMAAPTPVSAFLHSATMVKAGVFLVARLFPVLSELWLWPWLILPLGAVTMLLGGVVALNQHDLKRIFAYTTVSQLGLLMCMYGLGAIHFESHGHHYAAIDWDITQIANHAFYKAPLFILAGALGHLAGTRDLPRLFGAVRTQPVVVIVLLLAGYGLAAGPGTISFQAKELFLYSVYHAAEAHPVFWVLMAMTVATAACNVAIFVRLLTTLLGLPAGLRAAGADHAHDDHGHGHDEHHHEHGLWGAMIWVPGLVLVLLQFWGGLFTGSWSAAFAPMESSAQYFGFDQGLPTLVHALTHPGLPLAMSGLAIALGLVLGLSPVARGAIVDVHDRVYPAMYWLAVTGGGRAFRTIQTGNLRHYLLGVLGALLVGFAGAAWLDPAMLSALRAPLGGVLEFWPGLLLGMIVCVTALAIPLTEVRVYRVLLLGTCGFSVVGIYLVYQAPDLVLTQLMVEIISVLLFVLVLRLLPREMPLPGWGWGKATRLAMSAAVGLLFGWMTLVAATTDREAKLGSWFAQHTYAGTEATGGRGGGGENIVNVILVDFRGFDTLGEITVLALAALGVWAMMGQRGRRSA